MKTDQNSPNEASRRNFMTKMIYGSIALISGAIAVPLAGFGVLPTFKKKEAGWSELGSFDELPTNTPVMKHFMQTVKSGYYEEKVERTIWIIKKEDKTMVAYSPSCPHLGCGYQWAEGEKSFKCPCHMSTFDITGKVLGGPSPRALDTLETKVENGKVYVKYESFQMGIEKKELA